MKAIAVLNWLRQTVAQEITRADAIVISMAHNPAFPTPNPQLPDITTAINDLRTAQQAVETNGGGKRFIAIRNARRAELKALLTQLVSYVNNVADGNAEAIGSTAIPLKKAPVRRGRLGPVQSLKLSGIEEGLVKAVWKRLAGAATYHMQMSRDVSPLLWQEFAGNLVTEARTEINSLASGEKLWFRIIGVNTAGEGIPGDPVSVRVP